jgi:hypothetical protein
LSSEDPVSRSVHHGCRPYHQGGDYLNFRCVLEILFFIFMRAFVDFWRAALEPRVNKALCVSLNFDIA